MDKASDAILQLEPVIFHYTKDLDPDRIIQFGLIAEQVEKIDPDLVVRDADGKVSTVRYEAVNAMLLNEFLKEHRKLEKERTQFVSKLADQRKEFEAKFAQQREQIEALTAGLRMVNARIESEKTTSRVVSRH
jgi:Chaperone of endosialidase